MKDSRVLVVVQLDGGNDGINTIVPYKDEGYAKYRKELLLPTSSLLKVNDLIGLHPALGGAGNLFEDGRLAIVQGVGYPNPDRSHFTSMAIWHSSRPGRNDENALGWIGQALDSGAAKPGVPASVFAGAGWLPPILKGRKAVATAFSRPEDFVLASTAKPASVAARPERKENLAALLRRNSLDGYAVEDRMAVVVKAKDDAGARYPNTEIATKLRMLARLIKEDLGTRVFYTAQPGSYDTHAAQLPTHASLLSEWAGGVKAFLDDLQNAGLEDRVMVLSFSEFGRGVRENGALGTDHGTAGPVLLAGGGVNPGLIGTAPSLIDLDPTFGDLKFGIDFRQVFTTVLEDWLGLPAKEAVGGEFAKLPLFTS
jgi:uncharacterized protein (DUF1501 family)